MSYRDNAFIVRNLKKIGSKQTQLVALRGRRDNLNKRIRQLEEDLKDLELVNEVYDGVAMRVDGPNVGHDGRRWFGLGAIDHDIGRWAKAYDSAHDWDRQRKRATRPNRVGVNLSGKNMGGGTFQGCVWSWGEAEKICRDWVAHGTYPKRRQ